MSFESRWSLDPSGEYRDESRVSTREDIDRDSVLDDVVVESTERGKWSVNADGTMRFHVFDLEPRSLRINGEIVPTERAMSLLEGMISGAVGRVLTVGIDTLEGDTLEATVSGLATTCTR